MQVRITRQIPPTVARLAACAALLLSLAACSKPAAPPAPAAATGEAEDATARMARRLRQIASVVNEQTTLCRNDKRVEMMRARKEAAGGRSPGVQFEMQYAVQLMLAGQPEESIEQADRLMSALERSDRGILPNDRRTINRLKAIAWLRLGEQENCILDHSIDSCLLPIRGRGVHRAPRGSRAAAELYRELLEQDPDELTFRWLLNIAYMTLGEYPDGVPSRWRIPPETFASEYAIPRFYDVAVATGVAQRALSGGTVLEDLNGDGYLDIVVSSWGVEDQMHYFENDGQGGFVDRTVEAGLEGELGGLNMVHADFDNDGWADLLVLRGAWLGDAGMYPNSLLRNRGDGTFEDVTEAAGLLRFQPTHSAAWADYDNDGWLDLFVANESRSKRRVCELYHNNGDGTFSEVAASVGLDHVGFVKGVVWGDYDNDDRPDLFLSQWGQDNVLYHNDGPAADGAWRFSDVTAQAGVAGPRKSFPTWFFDYDNDGWLDLLVASFSDFGGEALNSVAADYLGLPTDATRTVLYRNRGDGTFEDVSRRTGMDRVLLAMGVNYGDLDNDGWLDAYFGTGEPSFYTLVPNVMLRNDAGQRFQDVTTAGGFGNIQKGHGIAFGDVDNDGDQDIYANMGGAYSGDVYQNVLFENPGFGNRWITLRLQGVHSNRSAIGARIRVVVDNEDGSTREIHRLVGTGGSFGSNSLQAEIGLGRAAAVRRLEVHWPTTGQTDAYTDVPLDRVLGLREGAAALEVVDAPPIRLHGSGGAAAEASHAGHQPG